MSGGVATVQNVGCRPVNWWEEEEEGEGGSMEKDLGRISSFPWSNKDLLHYRNRIL